MEDNRCVITEIIANCIFMHTDCIRTTARSSMDDVLGLVVRYMKICTNKIKLQTVNINYYTTSKSITTRENSIKTFNLIKLNAVSSNTNFTQNNNIKQIMKL